jgi:hypothetical protein
MLDVQFLMMDSFEQNFSYKLEFIVKQLLKLIVSHLSLALYRPSKKMAFLQLHQDE